MKRVVFRCDASLLIGSGHVMRCRTLARELQQYGLETVFLCRRQRGDLIKLLSKEFMVLTLPPRSIDETQGLQGRELYSSWLGCSQKQDADDCLSALGSADIFSADYLVVDHYGLDSRWEKIIREGLSGYLSPKLLVVDDLADRPHVADILLDQSFCGEITDTRYRALVSSECRQLLGPRYALLGPEYKQLHEIVPARSSLARILVFFGGVDQDNLTEMAIEALMDKSLKHLAVDVVAGGSRDRLQKLKELISRRELTALHGPLPSLAGMITRADLAIGAGGSTTWERICLQLPSLVISNAENQFTLCESLSKSGHIIFLGRAPEVTSSKISSAVHELMASKRLGSKIEPLVDGKGATRVGAALVKES